MGKWFLPPWRLAFLRQWLLHYTHLRNWEHACNYCRKTEVLRLEKVLYIPKILLSSSMQYPIGSKSNLFLRSKLTWSSWIVSPLPLRTKVMVGAKLTDKHSFYFAEIERDSFYVCDFIMMHPLLVYMNMTWKDNINWSSKYAAIWIGKQEHKTKEWGSADTIVVLLTIFRFPSL